MQIYLRVTEKDIHAQRSIGYFGLISLKKSLISVRLSEVSF